MVQTLSIIFLNEHRVMHSGAYGKKCGMQASPVSETEIPHRKFDARWVVGNDFDEAFPVQFQFCQPHHLGAALGIGPPDVGEAHPSGRAPHESTYALQKLIRAGFGTNYIDNCSRA